MIFRDYLCARIAPTSTTPSPAGLTVPRKADVSGGAPGSGRLNSGRPNTFGFKPACGCGIMEQRIIQRKGNRNPRPGTPFACMARGYRGCASAATTAGRQATHNLVIHISMLKIQDTSPPNPCTQAMPGSAVTPVTGDTGSGGQIRSGSRRGRPARGGAGRPPAHLVFFCSFSPGFHTR
jgi:hypothetical protein